MILIAEVTLAYEDHLRQNEWDLTYDHLQISRSLFQERHIDWSIWAVASSGKAERIHKLASWVSDIQEILPRGGKKHAHSMLTSGPYMWHSYPIPIQSRE